ncbi:MAG: hypothetical protein WAQ98_31900 [Blastocatellia bacterium]
MQNKNQNPWEPNMEWINEQDFFVDVEDPIYKEILELEEEPEEDAEIVNLLKTTNFIEISDNLKEKVLNSYRKEYVYQIFYHNIKIKVIEYRDLLFSSEQKLGLGITLASIPVLLILTGVAYYQYTKSDNAISTKPTLKITIVPSVTPTPNHSPSTTDIVDNIKIDEPEEITQNKINNSVVSPIRKLSKKPALRNITLKDASLRELINFYVVPDFGNTQNDKELRQAFIETLGNVDIRLLTTEEALVEDVYGKIIKKGDCIQILNSSNKKLLWQKCITNLEEVSKQDVEKIVFQLVKDYSNSQNQKTKKGDLNK